MFPRVVTTVEGSPVVLSSKIDFTCSNSHLRSITYLQFEWLWLTMLWRLVADEAATKQSKHEEKEERELRKQEEKQKKKEAKQQQELQEQLEKQKRKEAKQLKEQQEQEEKQRKKQLKKQVHLLSLLIKTCCFIVLHDTVPPPSPVSPLPPSPLPPFPSPLPKSLPQLPAGINDSRALQP